MERQGPFFKKGGTKKAIVMNIYARRPFCYPKKKKEGRRGHFLVRSFISILLLCCTVLFFPAEDATKAFFAAVMTITEIRGGI